MQRGAHAARLLTLTLPSLRGWHSMLHSSISPAESEPHMPSKSQCATLHDEHGAMLRVAWT